MQLFMRNVSFDATIEDLQAAVASRLHRPPFPTTTLTNFNIELFRGTKVGRTFGTKHGGKGILTLPAEDIGYTFLNLYGNRGIEMNSRKIFFKPHDRPPNVALIQQVASKPWQDPEEVHRKERRRKEFAGSIPLKSIAFGRFCFDGVFSNEFERIGSVSFDIQERRIIFRDGGPAPKQTSSTGASLFNFDAIFDAIGQIELETIFWISVPRVVAIVEVTSSRQVMFELELPPNFFRSEFDNLYWDEPKYSRMSSFDEGKVLPPFMRSLCASFDTLDGLHVFLERCRDLNAPRPIQRDITTAKRNLYSEGKVERLHLFSSTLSFALAFEVTKAFTAGILDPFQIYDQLGDELKNVDVAEKEHAALIFRLLVSQLTERVGLHIKQFQPKKRRGRKGPQRPRIDPLLADLPSQLQDATKEYWNAIRKPKKRFTFTPAIYSAFHLILTPTGFRCEGPLPDQSNSVLRRYENHDSFLKVSFQDEDSCTVRRERNVEIDRLLSTRFRPVFTRGLTFCGRRYEFLGYSMSSLREWSFMFMSPFEFNNTKLTANRIREQLGTFTGGLIYQPARLAARWAQAFSASFPSVTLLQNEIRLIDDIERHGSTFTDGCSRISRALSQDVWKKQKRSRLYPLSVPSCFQYRLGGAKGVVVQDPTIRGKVITLRPSQKKFEAPENLTLDIVGNSFRPMLCFLNRPLIALLEHHGVPIDVFRGLQDIAIREAQSIPKSLYDASTLISLHGLGSSFRLPSILNNITRILKLNVGERNELGTLRHELIDMALHFCSTHILRELKHRAHIRVPGSFTLIGVSDEWNCLEEGEIFARVVDKGNSTDFQIKGKVLITRSPQMHPGDAQFVTAVERRELSHLTNVVVFSCKGERSLPSCLGGGDLDGDIYNLILDETLHPSKSYISDPGKYTALKPKTTFEPCTVEDVADFIIDYMKSDLLGMISTLHLRFSDVETLSFDSPECLKLSEMASQAVDFPKVGIPVKMTDLPKAPKQRPDYLSGEGVNPTESETYYKSRKALGQLYRNVPLKEYSPESSEDGPVDSDAIVGSLRAATRSAGLPSLRDHERDPPSPLLDEMSTILEEYSEQLISIAKTHCISNHPSHKLSEAELVSGTIQQRYAVHRKRRSAVTEMNLQTRELTQAVRRELTRRPKPEDEDEDEEEQYDTDEDEEDEHDRELDEMKLQRAWAAWQASEEALKDDPSAFGAQSFGLIALGVMLEVIKKYQTLNRRYY